MSFPILSPKFLSAIPSIKREEASDKTPASDGEEFRDSACYDQLRDAPRAAYALFRKHEVSFKFQL